MKRSNRKTVTIAFGFAVFCYFFCLCGGILVASVPIGLPIELLLMLIYGWMIYAFLKYREGRQEEVTHLLCTAADAGAPLAPALWAYLEDRPRGWLREFWTALLTFFVLPGYYWIWHRGHSFERKVSRVAQFLEMGESLPNALREAPGVVSPGMVLAAEIGERTGRLADCLRTPLPRRLTSLWVEMLPRFLYPILLVIFMLNVLIFWGSYVLPKMEKIYFDFGEELPLVTQRLIGAEEFALDYMGTLVLGLLIIGILCGLFLANSAVRWNFPIFGRLYRRHQQSILFKMLAILLKVDMPAPQAIALLANSNYFARTVRRRLSQAGLRIADGQPLAGSLQQCGLLQSSSAPLVQSAERVRNLPWALDQLGETMGDRTVRFLRLFSQIVGPLLVIGAGLLVAFFAVGMFVPIVDLIARLAK